MLRIPLGVLFLPLLFVQPKPLLIQLGSQVEEYRLRPLPKCSPLLQVKRFAVLGIMPSQIQVMKRYQGSQECKYLRMINV